MFFLYVLSKGNVTVSVGILFLGHAFAQIMLREFTMLQQSHSQIDGLSMCPSMFVVCVCVKFDTAIQKHRSTINGHCSKLSLTYCHPNGSTRIKRYWL